ncbi:sulfatase-like hydrolase/transferase, partial [Acidobacteria bacterium AH-259-G07]|nr:sulfatase-like hydrolase/transferase [Acidobacteria bacterium AH-259-G07]
MKFLRLGTLPLAGMMLWFLAGGIPGTGSLASQSPSATTLQPFNVILITIDTLRADYLSCYGSQEVETPSLDSLAADGVLFETAYCQVPLTPPSHASILTGTYPASHGLRDFTSGSIRQGTVSLATILQKRGYHTAAFVSAFVLDESWGLDEGFDSYYDEFDLQDFEETNPGNVQRRAEETINQVLPWLDGARNPFFLWVHLFDPHHDYDPPPPFNKRYRSNPYAGEVAYTDSQIARLLAALRAVGRYDDSLIIATSDHGESLGEHGEDEHGFFLYEAALRIPLILKLPDAYQVKGKKVNAMAQTVDIVPTILQVLRIPSESQWRIEGRGLLSVILGKRSQDGFVYAETLYPQTTFGWSALRVYRQGIYKFIDAPRPELYNLVKDPHEQENLYPSNQSLAHQLRGKLQALEHIWNSSSESPGTAAVSEQVERLSALGYIRVDRPVPIRSDQELPDPKDKVHIYNRILKGLQASEAGRLKDSNSILEGVAKQNPELFIVHYSIGRNYLKLQSPERALRAFETARRLSPEFTSIELNSARALSMLGRVRQAIGLLQKVIQNHPTQIAAQRLLAALYTRTRDFVHAIQIYRQILEDRPDDKQATKFLGIALVESQKFEEGLKVLNRAIGLGLDDALIRNSQGIALANLGRVQEAIVSYGKAVEMKPDYPKPRLNLAFALLRSGKKEEALR